MFVLVVADEVIFRQGDPGSSFYIILHGTVSVRATDSRVSNSSVSSVRSDASTGGTTSAPDNAGNRGDGAPLEVGDRGSSANAEAEIEINQLSTGEYFVSPHAPCSVCSLLSVSSTSRVKSL